MAKRKHINTRPKTDEPRSIPLFGLVDGDEVKIQFSALRSAPMLEINAKRSYALLSVDKVRYFIGILQKFVDMVEASEKKPAPEEVVNPEEPEAVQE